MSESPLPQGRRTASSPVSIAVVVGGVTFTVAAIGDTSNLLRVSLIALVAWFGIGYTLCRLNPHSAYLLPTWVHWLGMCSILLLLFSIVTGCAGLDLGGLGRGVVPWYGIIAFAVTGGLLLVTFAIRIISTPRSRGR